MRDLQAESLPVLYLPRRGHLPVLSFAIPCRQFKADSMTHSAVAFELEGGWRDTKAAVVATVLQYLLGGGGSFSSGGPGPLYLSVHDGDCRNIRSHDVS